MLCGASSRHAELVALHILRFCHTSLVVAQFGYPHSSQFLPKLKYMSQEPIVSGFVVLIDAGYDGNTIPFGLYCIKQETTR
jgi:hypothetical protein